MSLKGRDFLLKLESAANPGLFQTVGGMRSNGVNINGETVDVTTKDSNGFREYLAGAGLRSISVSGSGVLKNEEMILQVNQMILTGEHGVWQVIIPNFGTYTGTFAISSFSMDGQHNGEMTFSMSLESAGEITFSGA